MCSCLVTVTMELFVPLTATPPLTLSEPSRWLRSAMMVVHSPSRILWSLRIIAGPGWDENILNLILGGKQILN